MQCMMCRHGGTGPGTTTMTFERDGTIVVFKNIPAEVCQICGEAYLSAATTQHLLRIVEEATLAGVQFQVRS
jgi:YgiT-type zinc finger domain-containing protein